MSVSGVSSTPAPLPVQLQPTAATNVRNLDGDYKTANSKTVNTKDSDGDFKPVTTASSPASVSSSSTLSALSGLKMGG